MLLWTKKYILNIIFIVFWHSSAAPASWSFWCSSPSFSSSFLSAFPSGWLDWKEFFLGFWRCWFCTFGFIWKFYRQHCRLWIFSLAFSFSSSFFDFGPWKWYSPYRNPSMADLLSWNFQVHYFCQNLCFSRLVQIFLTFSYSFCELCWWVSSWRRHPWMIIGSLLINRIQKVIYNWSVLVAKSSGFEKIIAFKKPVHLELFYFFPNLLIFFAFLELFDR